ncbi:hypothetical protein LguiA_017658 [Lonicera macranthoides]
MQEVEDAQKICVGVIDCFEKAVLLGLTEEERKANLHFVIVGGGPTGVEFAAELHDFFQEDLFKISAFAEQKFRSDGIEVLTGRRVVSVTDKVINMKLNYTGEHSSISHGMVVWSTGVGTRPVIMDFMEQIGQADRRVLATNEWLQVKGCQNVYALGDCATIDQRKIMGSLCLLCA